MANDTNCPVKQAGEALLKQGSNYLHPGSGKSRRHHDPLMFKPAYDEILHRQFHVPRPNDYYPVTYDFAVKEIDYLVDPIRNSQELLQAERQAEQHEKIGAFVHSKRIRQRIAEASRTIYGKQTTTTEQECISVAEKLKSVAWETANAGDLALAEKQYRAIVAIYQKELPGTPLVGNALSDLARVCEIQGRYDDAKKLFQQTISLYESMPAYVDTEVVATYEHYADLIQRENPAQATELFAKASAKRRELYKETPAPIKKTEFTAPQFPVLEKPVTTSARPVTVTGPWSERHTRTDAKEHPFADLTLFEHADPRHNKHKRSRIEQLLE